MPDCRSLIVLFDADDLAGVEAACPQALSGEVLAFQTEIHLLLTERGIRHTTPWAFVARDDRSGLEALEADIWRHWSAHACLEFEGIKLLNMAAFRHVAAFARLAWAAFSIRRALQQCRPACVYAFDEPPAHGLDQPADYVKMPLLSGVIRGLAEQSGLEVRLIQRGGARTDSCTSQDGPNAGAVFEDQVAKRSDSMLEPVVVDRALGGRPYILFNGNGDELLRQLPLIRTIHKRTGIQCVQLYKDASLDQVSQLQNQGHHVWHESQIVRFDNNPGIEQISHQARTVFDAAGCEATGELGAIFNNPHMRGHFDFLFGTYARKMAGHVRTWRGFFARQRPAAFVANYHAPIFDVAADRGIPCLALPHGMTMQGLPAWFLTLPRKCFVGAISESHRLRLIAVGLPDQRIRVIGNPNSIATVAERQGGSTAEDHGAEIRRRYGLPANQRIILLCTASLGKPSQLPHAPIADWAEGVRNMFELARMASSHQDWTLVVKQHPRYDHPMLYQAVNRTLPPHRRMVVLSQEPLRPLAAAADVVCIWNSVTSAIVEASFAGKPVVVFSKAMVWYDRAAWGCQAWPHIDDLDRLEAELEKLLGDPGYHAAQARRTREAAASYVEEAAGPGTDRCVAVIEELLHKNGEPVADVGARRDSRTSRP